MTDHQRNALTINAFICRAVNMASNNAMDAEFGLRVRSATINDFGNIEIEFAEGRTVIVGPPVAMERKSPAGADA